MRYCLLACVLVMLLVGCGDNRLTFKPQNLTDITAISGGMYHTIALRRDGAVWAWGVNYSGQLGDGTLYNHSIPVRVVGPDGEGYLTDISALACGWHYTIALKSDGTVWTWGENYSGQLGDGTTTDRCTPVQAVGPGGLGYLTSIIAIAGGGAQTIAVKDDGTVWTWGYNIFGQLGDGTTTDSCTPVQVVGPGGSGYLTNVTAGASGQAHTMALENDGTVWTWGANYSGQLGDGTTTDKHAPVQVVGPGGVGYLTGIIGIACGVDTTIALKNDGSVWAWGGNYCGELGDGTTTIRYTPVQVVGPGGSGYLTGISAIASGESNTMALKNDGTVWVWGDNYYGQLGDGTTADSYTPVQVVGPGGTGYLTGITGIAGGRGNAKALRNDGTVWTWGWNMHGELGDGTTTDSYTPVQVRKQ